MNIGIVILIAYLFQCTSADIFITGFDQNYDPITDTELCNYPTECYLKTEVLYNVSGVMLVGLAAPNDMPDCNISEHDSPTNVYAVFGTDSNREEVNGTIRFEKGLWNS